LQIKGRGEGSTIKWKHSNVDVDVQIANCGRLGSGEALAKISTAEGVHVRLRGIGLKTGRTFLELVDVQQYVVDLGPIGWEATSASNKGVVVKVGAGGAAGGSTKGVIREGPMFNVATGKSVELDNNTTKTWVYPGPDEIVALGTGEGNQKVVVP
jgi:hypothetical protein